MTKLSYAPLLGLFVLSLQIGCAPPPRVGERSSAIIGGSLDSGDPAVVLLISYPPDHSTYYTCTAEVISPEVLVTAAHCVDEPNHPSYTFGVFLGNDASSYETITEFATVLLPVASVHAYPEYDPNSPFTGDVGVVIMESPLSVSPLPIARSPLTSAIVGQPARIVGYGQTVYGTYNAVKYSATTTVASLAGGTDDTVIVGDAQKHSCVGDSGGPALFEISGVETIIGVDSYTDTTGCTEPSHYRRLDLYTSFFDTYLAAENDDLGPTMPDASMPIGEHTDAAATQATPDAAAQPNHHAGHGCAFAASSPTSCGWLLVLMIAALAMRRAGASGGAPLPSRAICRGAFRTDA